MLSRTCQNCYHAIEAIAVSRTILICNSKFGCEAKFFVLDPKDTCGNFKPTNEPPSPDDGSKLIPLTQGKFAIVDADDYDWLNRYKWCVAKKRHIFYAARRTNGEKISMHRVIMGATKGLLIDHKDGDGLNNRKSNLRLCTIAQNNRNSRPWQNSTSKYKGVSWSKSCRKWQARIRPNRRTIYLGLFDNEIEAAVAYDRKAEELFGEFAYLNFPLRQENSQPTQ
jgi:hypothetical protein